MSPIKFTVKRMQKMTNTQGVKFDSESLKSKQNLLEMIFNKNYEEQPNNSPNRQREENKAEDYSPGFKNLVADPSPNTWKGNMRSNKIYDSAKSIIHLRQTNSTMVDPKDNYDFSQYSSQSRSKMQRSHSYSVNDKRYASPKLKVIKSIRYNEKEDRTIVLREKLAIKQSVLKDQIRKKALLLQKKNEKVKEEMGKVIKFIQTGASLSLRNKEKKPEEGYLNKINSGILKRYGIF
jgi:hypothetical protein